MLLWPPPEGWMSPVHILDFSHRLACQLLINVHILAVLVAPLHPEQQQDTRNENRSAGCQIQAVTNLVVGTIKGQEAPGRDQATDVAEHDNRANSRGSGCIRYNVAGCLCVTEGAEGEGSRGDQEGGSVTNLGVVTGKEHLCIVSRKQTAC